MKCPKCGSENVSIQMVTETRLQKKHHGILYWLFCGWLIDAALWFFLTIPRLIVSIFRPRRYKVKTVSKKKAICQSCGKSWAA